MIDSVQIVSRIIEYHHETPDAIQQVVSLWRHLAPKLPKSDSTSQPQASLAFLQALVRARYHGELSVWYCSIKEFSQLLQTDTGSNHNYMEYQSLRNIAPLTNGCRNRRFVALSRSLYGVAPSATRKGDVCAIIFGTRSPVILRKVAGEERYQVVGAVFLLSNVTGPKSKLPLRMGRSERCEDWKDWNLPTQELDLV